MPDNLKAYIDQSREEFEVYAFDTNSGWEQLSGAVASKPRSGLRRYFVSGIAACLLFAAGWFSFSAYQERYQSPDPRTLEWLEAENFYRQEINSKLMLVKGKVNDPAVYADLEEMDKALSDLKDDLGEHINNEEVIVAMMNSYRLKLKILERILEDLEEDEDKKIDRHINL